MIPYLAVIKDSFREALASRVLWSVLVFSTLLLIGLAPFGWSVHSSTSVYQNEIRNLDGLVTQLKLGQAEETATKLQRHVWTSLDEEMRSKLSELSGPVRGRSRFELPSQLAESLTRMMERDDFFRVELWQEEVRLPPRMQELTDVGQRSSEQEQRLRRWGLETALAGQLVPCPDEVYRFSYFVWEIDQELFGAMNRQAARRLLDSAILLFMPLFLGFFGILVAVLVTAPIIPNMLDSGSLFLLLSKPISRSKLYLAKFLGGCSFVLICVAYLVVGIVAILWFRFGVWKPELLWSILIFLFSFAIFYSVSALVGLVWRNTIMAVAATIVFWFVCFAMGATKSAMDLFVVDPERMSQIVETEQGVVVVRDDGTVSQWQEEAQAWLPTLVSRTSPPPMGPPGMRPKSELLGPAYDPQEQHWIAIEPRWPQPNVWISQAKPASLRAEPLLGPKNSRALFAWKSAPDHPVKILAVADEGIYQFQALNESSPPRPAPNIFGWKLPQSGSESFLQVSAGRNDLRGQFLAAYDTVTPAIWTLSERSLVRWEERAERFEPTSEIELASEVAPEGDVVSFAACATHVMIVDKEGHVWLLESATGTIQQTCQPQGETRPRKAVIDPHGKWCAVLFSNDRLWVFDIATQREQKRPPRQGAIAGIATTSEGQLMISDLYESVRTYSVADWQAVSRRDGKPAMVRQIHRLAIRPLHWIFPKPSELANTNRYLVTGKDTEEIESPGDSRTVKFDPWQPVLSNVGFVAIMLLLGCAYIHWQDF